MEINITKLSPNRLIVKLSGKINIESADEFEKTVKDNLENIQELVIDCNDIVYISSFGLRKILELHNCMEKQHGAMYIKNVNGDVKNVFDISGFSSILKIV